MLCDSFTQLVLCFDGKSLMQVDMLESNRAVKSVNLCKLVMCCYLFCEPTNRWDENWIPLAAISSMPHLCFFAGLSGDGGGSFCSIGEGWKSVNLVFVL